MILPNGYEMTTTFFSDFSIANSFGLTAIQDTWNRAFAEWKDNYVYLSELSIVLNIMMWKHYDEKLKVQSETCELYKKLYMRTDDYAYTNLKGEELKFYFKLLD